MFSALFAREDLGLAHAGQRWWWFVALGALLLAFGIFACFETILVTLASAVLIGAAAAVAGVFQLIHAAMMRGWRGFFFNLLSGGLYLIGGVLMMQEPLVGSVVITMIIAFLLIVAGITRVTVAITHRELHGWGVLLASGILSLLVGVVLYMSLPWAGLWVLGTLVAFDLMLQGVAWLEFGFALRRVR